MTESKTSMPRLMILSLVLVCVLCTVSSADDEQPYDELLYPVEVQGLDYVSRVGDSFFVNTRIATPDDFETVVNFYADKLDRELQPRENRMRFGGREPLVSIVTNDSHGVTDAGLGLNFDKDMPRGISLVTFVKITPQEQITLVISRLDGEEYTHIVLTHAKQASSE